MTERITFILQRLKKIQRRIFFTRTVLGFLLFIPVLLFFLLLSELCARLGHGSVIVGLLFWFSLLAGIIGLIIWLRKSWLSSDQTALACERKFPELNDGLISLVQLSRILSENKADFSLTLFEKHLEQIEEKLSRIPLEQVAETQRLRLPALITALLFVIWITFIFFSPGFPRAMSQAIWLKGLSQTPGKEMLKVSRPLELYDLTLDYQFPAYTALPERHIEGADGSIKALAGSEVQISAKSPVKLVKAWIQLSSQKQVPVEIKGETLQAKLTILQSGQYRIEAEDKNGKLWAEPKFNQITALPDQVPEVELLEPEQDQVVNEEQGLLLKFRARDDYGLESVSLVFTHRGKEKRILLKQYRPASLEIEEEYFWELVKENFTPGEKVVYYLEAKDNNNVTGPGLGKSPPRSFELFSPLKAHEQVLSKEQELFENLIALLGKTLEAEIKKWDAVKFWEMETTLLAEFKKVRNFLEKLKSEVEKDEYSPMLAREMIMQSLERYQQLLRDRLQSQKIKDQTRTRQLWKNTITRLEQDILFWDEQLQKQRMDYLLTLADRLKAFQKELKELMARYELTKDPDLLSEIEEKLNEMKLLYQEFLARMNELGQTVPDEFVNMDALEKVGAGEVMSQLEKLRQAVHDRDMENALQNAEDFMGMLDQMLGQLEQGAEKMGSGISAEMLSALNQGLNQLKELKSAQEALIQDTEPIYQKQVLQQEQARANLSGKKNQLQAQLEQLSQLIEKQKQELNILNPGSNMDLNERQVFYQLRNQLMNKLWQLSRDLEQANRNLEQGEMDSLSPRLKQIENRLSEFHKDLNLIEQGTANKEQAQNIRGTCNSALAKTRAVRNTLSQEPELRMSDADSAKLKALAKRQGEIESKLSQLIQELGGVFENLPVKPPKTIAHLLKADVKMKDAQGELELKNVDLGLAGEKEAKYWLEQASESLENFMNKMKEKAQPSSMPMSAQAQKSQGAGQQGQNIGRPRLDNFKIPGPDENQGPIELRKKILRAMRENSPKEYEDLNRDYYKRLVQ